MPYSLNDKLKYLTPYDPTEGKFKIRLDANESYINCFEILNEKILSALKTVEFNRYPDPYANNVANAFSKLYNISKDNVTAGNGSDEIISIITSCFLEKGDSILTLAPDFSMYAFYGKLYEVNVHTLEKDNDLNINVDSVINYCNENNIKALIFSNPCNPTSLGINKDEVLRLISSVQSLVILDEAYMDFWTESVLEKVNDYDNLIILKTCSKALGLAGIRLGFAVANPVITTALRAAKSPFNTDSVSQVIGQCVLEERELINKNISKIIESREFLYKSIIALSDKYSVIEKVFKPCTNFVFIKASKCDEIYQKLLENSIAIRNFSEYLRISAGSKAENDEFLAKFEDILKNL